MFGCEGGTAQTQLLFDQLQRREVGGTGAVPVCLPSFVAGDTFGIWAGMRRTNFHFCRPVEARLKRGP